MERLPSFKVKLRCFRCGKSSKRDDVRTYGSMDWCRKCAQYMQHAFAIKL